MLANYPDILRHVLVHEGGFSNRASDGGGATMKGVTQAVYDAFRRLNGRPRQTVRNISEEELQAIYDRQYWDRVAGDALPSGLDYAVFDFAVNSGVARSVEYLQRCLVARKIDIGRIDGDMGMKTMAGVLQANDPKGLIRELCKRRLAFMKRAVGPKGRLWPEYGAGWTTRVNGVLAYSLKLAG